MPGSGRALGISGWLVAAALAITYLMASYDVTIHPASALAAPVNGKNGEMKPVVDEQYTELVALAQSAAGADLLAVDRRLEAAEREFPSDYRFTYERAALAVYGQADHHEAFYHLRRATEKAIGTERAREMLVRLEQDGGPEGRLRRLAVGHDEWSVLHEALEHRDSDRLWHVHVSHPPAPGMGVSLPLEHGTPCIDALVAFRKVPMDPGAKITYHRLRDVCLRGSARGQPPAPVSGLRHR